MYYKNLLLFAILCQSSLATSQNLVKNPGFEDHTPVICLYCHAPKEFFAHVNGWHNDMGWGVWFVSKKYEFKKSETDLGYYKKDYLPRTGDGVVQLVVRGKTSQGSTKGSGGSSYLYTKLSKTLVPGTLYRLQMWVKIKNRFVNTGDWFDFLKHFGMELSDKKPKIVMGGGADLIRSYSPFLLDTVVSGEWIPINYIIRPTRPLNLLTIGWFEHPLHPVYWRNEDNRHWVSILVDDISVAPILQPSTQDSLIAFDYPSEKPLKGRRVDTQKDNKIADVCGIPDSVNVYFDNKIDTLNAPSKALLDSLALCLKKDTIEYALYIRGFTDVVGSATDNQALSARRAEAVKQYLRTRHQLSELRLMTSSHGEEGPVNNPIKNNPGHQRRVEIVKSSIRVSDLIYRKLSYCATKGQSDSAFYWIKEWVKKRESDKILLLFDPELDVLHTDKRWKAIPQLVRQAYKKYTASATAFELDSVYFSDQYYRTLPSDLEKIKGYIPSSLDFTFDQLKHLDTSLSEKHIPYITQRLDKHGWPSPNMVGERAALTPALILIHSQDLALRKKYLPMAEAAYKTKKINPDWYAMLFDRIMIDEKGVQCYATQYKGDKDDPTTYRLVPVENPELVNERRAAIGMYPKDMSFTWFKIVEKVKK
jgi:outer membrane protein OmpA-like peptidoglycan-associated protein